MFSGLIATVYVLCTMLTTTIALLGSDPNSGTGRFVTTCDTPAAKLSSRIQSAPSADSGVDFEDAFKPICKSRKLTVIVEGTPLVRHLSPAVSAEVLDERIASNDGNADTELVRIALAFDYDVDRIDNHTVLLRKRYSDPNDLPCVTGDEVVHALKAITDIIDSYSSSPPYRLGEKDVYFSFFDSLTKAQETRAKSGITLADLTPDQQALALSAARAAVLDQGTTTLRAILDQLLLLPNQRTTFGWMKLVGGDAFGYQGPFRFNGTLRHFPLNNGFSCQVGGSYRHVSPRTKTTTDPSQSPIMRPADTNSASSSAVDTDPALPTQLDRELASGMLSRRLPSTVTIGELVSRLSERALPGVQYTVEPRIAAKPVCVFGESYSTLAEIARDVASIYGLRVISPKHAEFRIACVVPRRIEFPITAAGELVRMVPLPLSHYYSGQKGLGMKGLPVREVPANVIGIGAKGLRDYYKTSDGQMGDSLARNSLYLPVVRRLLALALPFAPTIDSPPVPVSSVGPEAYRLISLLMLSGGGMGEIEQLRDFEPKECIAKPKSLWITISTFYPQGSQQFDMRFGHLDDAGKFETDGGIRNGRSSLDAIVK